MPRDEASNDFLIKVKTIVTLDPDTPVIHDGALLVHDGKIHTLGPARDLEKDFSGTVIQEEHGLAMPGLINSHTHLPMSLFRGLADDLPLDVWLNSHMFPAEARCINDETAYLGALLSCAEMLLSGTTCCCDGYFHENQVARAVRDSGMRGVLAQGVIDFPAPGVPDPSQNVAIAADYVDAWTGTCTRIHPSIFCHSPYTCSESTLVRAKEEAVKRDALFQIHVAETRTEWEMINREKGMSPVAYLGSSGILDSRTLVVHAVHMDDKDMDILARTGARVAHAPESNMKLASGTAPVPSFMSRSIVCGLGTDSSASNNSLDMFLEMDTCAKLHKLVWKDPSVMTADQVLTMATTGGAMALGLQESIGMLAPGKQADIIVLDTRKPHLVPMYNPVSHLVYAATGADVLHVLVDGRFVVRDRILMSFDLDSLMDQIRDLSESLKAFL